MTRRLCIAAAALAAFAAPASALGAGACVPEFDQPDLTPGYTVGVLDSAQGAPATRRLSNEMFRATWQRLEFATDSDVRVLSDADIVDPSKLADLKVLVLPQSTGLSIAQRRALSAWVKAGGGLVSVYQSGRANERGVPLVPKGLRVLTDRRPTYGDLSTAFGARVTDVGMIRATFRANAGSELVQRAAAFCGGPLPDYVWRRDRSPVAITGELATLSRGATPFASLSSAVIRPGGRRVPNGATFAWTNTYGAGRVAHFGFNVMDAWRNYTFSTYYEGVDESAPDTGVALLRGAVEWASGSPTAPVPGA